MAACRPSASRAFRHTASTCSIGRSRCSIRLCSVGPLTAARAFPHGAYDQNGRGAPSDPPPEQRPEVGDPRPAT